MDPLVSLDKDRLISLLHIQEACLKGSSNWQDVAKIVGMLKDVVPFDSAIISFNSERDGEREGMVANFGFNPSWLELYSRAHLREQDPCFHYARRVQHAFDYDEAAAAFAGSSQWFRERAREHGHRSGLCCGCGINTSATSTLINLSGSQDEQFDDVALAVLDLVTPHLHEMLIGPGEIRNTVVGVPKFTKTEREVLEWCKEGKSAWEIGQITSRSERTVKFHLSNIYQKLGCTTRAQAVAKACSFGLISL